MSDLNDDQIAAAIDAMLQGKTVYVGVLFYVDFGNGPGRFWTAGYTLRTRDGELWKGAGRMISIDVIAPAIGTAAAPATLKLSGVDQDIVAKIVPNIDNAIERDVIAYAQFFGDGVVAPYFEPLGDPIAIGGWVSDQVQFDKSATERTITLSLENYFVGRSRSPASFYSYSEQNDRAIAMGFAGGDQSGRFMTSLQNKTITFPDY